jgi:hypothetical protein
MIVQLKPMPKYLGQIKNATTILHVETAKKGEGTKE